MHCCVASPSCGVNGAVGTVSAMHRPGPLPATLLALALLAGSCGAPGPGPALLDVKCPGEPVPTLLEVTCGRLALDDVTLRGPAERPEHAVAFPLRQAVKVQHAAGLERAPRRLRLPAGHLQVLHAIALQ